MFFKKTTFILLFVLTILICAVLFGCKENGGGPANNTDDGQQDDISDESAWENIPLLNDGVISENMRIIFAELIGLPERDNI